MNKNDSLDVSNLEALAPLAPSSKISKGMLAFMPPLVQEFAAKSCDFKIESNGKCLMEGFYKNGPMELSISDDGKTMVATDKRGRATKIESYIDLLKLNYAWWRSACSRNNYVSPIRPFLDGFIAQGWVGRQTIYVPKDGEAPISADEPILE